MASPYCPRCQTYLTDWVCSKCHWDIALSECRNEAPMARPSPIEIVDAYAENAAREERERIITLLTTSLPLQGVVLSLEAEPFIRRHLEPKN